jgi:hypothetical protein
MCLALTDGPRIRHRIPGRLRAHVPDLGGPRRQALESTLRQLPGVSSVRANPLTDSVLIHFDPARTDECALLAGLRSAGDGPPPADELPLLSAAMRLAGSATGGGAPAMAVGVLAFLVSVAPVRPALQQLLGPTAAHLVCHLADLLHNLLSGDTLGLVLQVLKALVVIGKALAGAL